MAIWTISKKLNVSPYAAPLVIQVKQYTSDFALKLQLYSTVGDLDIPAGATTKIRGTKRDGNGYELTGTRIGHTCTFSGTKEQMQQMTAAHGRCVFEVVVEHDGKELITANFYLEVQRAAMDAGTVTSESIIEEFADFQSKITAAQAAATAAQAQADRAEAAAASVDFGLDVTPTQGSTNAVGSNGTFTALEGKADKASLLSGYFIAPIAGTGYISRDDGSVSANVDYWYSDYIDISGCDSLVTKSAYDSAFNAFYDASKAFVSAFVIRTGTDLTLAIPDNAVYMRVSATKARYADANVFKLPIKSKVDALETGINSIQTAVESLEDGFDAISTATDSDVGKALKAKTVTNGKVTEWEFGEAGSGDSKDLINGYFTPAVEGTGNISRDDGSVGSDSAYSHSDYIDISGYSQLTTRASYDSAFNAFYDANKGFVSAFVIRTGTDLTVAIPANAVYMRVSTLTDRYDASFVFRYLARDNADKISALQDEVSALANQSSDYFTPPIVSTGYISNQDGTEQASADYSRSDYVDISQFSKLLTVALADGAFNAFYDANKSFISSFTVRAGTNQVITLPANTAYMRVSAVTSAYNNIYRFRPIGYVNAVRIADLEDTVDSLANQSSDYFVPTIEGTGNISRDNGAVVTNADYSHSGYVNISDFKALTTYATVTGNFNAFYDASKNFISAFSVRAGDGLTLEIPDGAVYMRVSTGTSSYNSTYIFGTVSHSNAVRISDLEDTVDGLLNGDSGEYFSPPSVGSGNVSRNDGSIQTSNYLHSDYIDISQYSRLITNAEVGSAFNAFYRADKTFISPFSITAGADKNIEVPFGAMYMRVSAGNDVYDSVMKFRTFESITTDALPDYWYGHITDKVDTLRNRMGTIGRNGETFVFITDIHWYMNQQKSPKLIKYLLNNLNINMVFLGGDLITEGAKADEVVESMRCIKAFQYPDIFTPMDFGNHENNSNQPDATQRFDANTVYSLFFKGFEDDVTWMTDTEFSFYFDKAVNKTRYIFLDMGDDGVSKAFTAFAPFRDALLSTPNGYKIVIVAHIIDYGTFTTSLTQMIDAYNARTTVTVNSVVCDFTSASGSVVICLGGHRHYDDETATAGGVPITVTDCDAMLSVSDITETAGTITEQAFDVVSLDYTNMIAYYERIGRNKSRIIHMTPVSASTTLTTSMSGTVTWSSRDDSIATVSNGVITRVASGTVIIRADNGTETEIWVCNS